MVVRDASASDLVGIVRAAKRFHDEAPHHRDYVFSIAKVEQLVLDAITNPEWLAIVAMEKGRIVGLGLFACLPMFFSDSTETFDLTWWVHPDARGTSAGPRMLKRFIEWSRMMGASRAQIGVNTGIEPERTARLLGHLGFETHGTIHVLSLVH